MNTADINSEALYHVIKDVSPFIYLPNLGNYGDLLIAEATRQKLRALGVQYTEYNGNIPENCHVVFAGGAKITNEWGTGEDSELHVLNDSRIKKCLVLPHSINGPDTFLNNLNERYTLCCRETTSIQHVQKHAPAAQTLLSHDMAITLDLNQTKKELAELDSVDYQSLNSEEKLAYELLKNGFSQKLKTDVLKSSVTCNLSGVTKRIAFLLRDDKEKASHLSTEFTFDIAGAWTTSGRAMRFNSNLLIAFSDALKTVDVVVTDRLHVAIMAWHSGREVYMLDNSYKKLSGVYNLSLKHDAKVHLLEDGCLTPELDAAWARFNLEKTVNSCHNLLKNQEQQLAANAMALSSLQEHTQSLQEHIQSLQEELRTLRLKQSYGKMKKRMLYCRIMSKLSFGKKKHKYTAEKRRLKDLLLECTKTERI